MLSLSVSVILATDICDLSDFARFVSEIAQLEYGAKLPSPTTVAGNGRWAGL